MRKQKEICEGENERLRRQLSGGRPEAAITIETASKQTEKIITTLNLQVIFPTFTHTVTSPIQ